MAPHQTQSVLYVPRRHANRPKAVVPKMHLEKAGLIRALRKAGAVKIASCAIDKTRDLVAGMTYEIARHTATLMDLNGRCTVQYQDIHEALRIAGMGVFDIRPESCSIRHTTSRHRRHKPKPMPSAAVPEEPEASTTEA